MNIRLVVEYDGTNYHGFQIQKNGVTVQEELEKAIGKLTRDPFVLYFAGRTDTGVHAHGQVCNFKSDSLKVDIDDLAYCLNGILPKDICVKNADTADDDFHSRFSAKERIYRYIIYNSSQRTSLYRNYCWHICGSLDLDEMKKASQSLLGVHDFKAFTACSYPDSTVRNVKYINIYRSEDFIYTDICANAYTRSMVRNIVGTLCEIGTGKRHAEEIQDILLSCDRNKAGKKAPAQGLYLLKIEY